MKNRYKVIGLMSGTSLDGLDIAYCIFDRKQNGWSYKIDKATTVKYPKSWRDHLSLAQTYSGEALIRLDRAYAGFLGEVCADFIKTHRIKADFIASHGHTIFHQPEKGFTYQLGDGNTIHVVTKVPVIFDFRSLDVALGGEGAPLVPAGDKRLFSDYDICLNLGGIANLSMDIKKARVAFDICFANMPLNYLMGTVNKTFDRNGEMASSGEVNLGMLKQLDKMYNKIRGKRPSLGREIFEMQLKPVLDKAEASLEDKLRTICESTAKEIAQAFTSLKNPSVLCTGGGAFNTFFMSRLLDYCGDTAILVMPDEEVVKFKEALVFAFLGVLRVEGEVNCLKSVTGASRDSSSGVLVGLTS